MDRVVGFIGNGNMGSAMIHGIMKAKLLKAEQLYVSAAHEESLQEVKQLYGVHATCDNIEVAKASDILVLAVKPYQYETVIEEIKDAVKKEVIIVNIAAGKSIEHINQMFGREMKVVKAMPNTPAFVGEAMSALAYSEHVTPEELEHVISLFQSFGKVEIVAEGLMDAVTAVSGSSPAYVFMFIEAMADGAVALGMPRKQAYTFAGQAVLGAAKMLLESGQHPGELKDAVCSPQGTTISAVQKLEECGFRSSVMQAMLACADKSKEMQK